MPSSYLVGWDKLSPPTSGVQGGPTPDFWVANPQD
jgi:hypothetical protein